MYFPPAAFCLLLTARKGKTLLNYFPSPHTSPPLRSFPRHQQSHPENQFAQEAGLFNSRRGDWRLHHTPVALHVPLMTPTDSRKNINCKSDQVFFISPSFCCTSLFLNQEFTEVKNYCCGKESISLYFEVLIGSLFILLNYEKISIWELCIYCCLYPVVTFEYKVAFDGIVYR